jgi:hypothetical protein
MLSCSSTQYLAVIAKSSSLGWRSLGYARSASTSASLGLEDVRSNQRVRRAVVHANICFSHAVPLLSFYDETCFVHVATKAPWPKVESVSSLGKSMVQELSVPASAPASFSASNTAACHPTIRTPLHSLWTDRPKRLDPDWFYFWDVEVSWTAAHIT